MRALLKNAFGAKLKLISGYPGTAEMAIAIERGEVDSRASWSWTSLKTLKPDWIAEKKVDLPGAAQPDQGPGPAGRAADHRVRQRTTSSGRCSS